MNGLRTLVRHLVVGFAIVVIVGTAILAILARVVKSPATLGVRDGKLAPCPNSPNCVSTQSDDPRHRIDPIPYATSVEAARAALLATIEAADRATIVTSEPTYLHVEFAVPGIGYTDDVEFYLDEAARVIHFRSSARLPYWDWNVNRNRMEGLRAAFGGQVAKP